MGKLRNLFKSSVARKVVIALLVVAVEILLEDEEPKLPGSPES